MAAYPHGERTTKVIENNPRARVTSMVLHCLFEIESIPWPGGAHDQEDISWIDGKLATVYLAQFPS